MCIRDSFTGGGGFGGSNFRRPRLSPSQLAEQALLEAKLAADLQKQQAELEVQRRQEFLTQLGREPNSRTNKRQIRAAFEEAQNNYRALNQSQVSANELGFLKQPFRLRKDTLDHQDRSVKWTSVLQEPEFKDIVESLDLSIMENSVTNSEEATAFVKQLSELNQKLNQAAVRGDVQRNDFAHARRLISGLANEVEASGISLTPDVDSDKIAGNQAGQNNGGTNSPITAGGNGSGRR